MTDTRRPGGHTDDGVLARAHLNGDPDAFAVLYRRYFPDVVAFVDRRVHDHAHAEDLAQETMARALRHLATYDTTRPMWPWLQVIARRVIANTAPRRATEVPLDDVARHHDEGMADGADRVVTRDAIVRSMRKVPARQRRALVMRYLEDRHPAEVATAFGLTPAAYEQLLLRARRSLARAFREADGLRGGLAALPLVVRARRYAAGFDARFSSLAETALAIGGNVAVATAIAAGGVTVAGALGGGPVPASPVAAQSAAASGAERPATHPTRVPRPMRAPAGHGGGSAPGAVPLPPPNDPPRGGTHIAIAPPHVPGSPHGGVDVPPKDDNDDVPTMDNQFYIDTPLGPITTEGHGEEEGEGGPLCHVDPRLCE